jgi:uncharacterized protein (TIGR03066 family)
MRVFLGCTLAVLMAGAGLAADEKIDAKKLVGKWEPKDQKKGGTFVLEFTKDGKLIFHASQNGKDFNSEGTYKLDGNKLSTTMKFGDMERKMTRTINKLTDTELVSTDEKGKEDTLVRAKGNKGKK